MTRVLALLLAALLTGGFAPRPAYDVVIRGGTIYDGRGGAPYLGDVAIRGDRIVAVGRVSGRGAREVSADAAGQRAFDALQAEPGALDFTLWVELTQTDVEQCGRVPCVIQRRAHGER